MDVNFLIGQLNVMQGNKIWKLNAGLPALLQLRINKTTKYRSVVAVIIQLISIIAD